MGYIIVGVLFVMLLGLVFIVVARSTKKPARGTLTEGVPVVRDKPSADEPTPGRSALASDRQEEKARRHTPPA